jgi:hypothetical protein
MLYIKHKDEGCGVICHSRLGYNTKTNRSLPQPYVLDEKGVNALKSSMKMFNEMVSTMPTYQDWVDFVGGNKPNKMKDAVCTIAEQVMRKYNVPRFAIDTIITELRNSDTEPQVSGAAFNTACNKYLS